MTGAVFDKNKSVLIGFDRIKIVLIFSLPLGIGDCSGTLGR